MKTELLVNVPFKLDPSDMMKTLHIRSGTDDEHDFLTLLDQAQKIANPKIIYGIAGIDEIGEDRVVIEGFQFSSRVLSVNLEKIDRVFPFVVTCGMELQIWAEGIQDMIWNFWAEGIKEAALYSASNTFIELITARFQLGHVSTMSPGSLVNWPISQQIPLFELLGDTQALAGVRLTDSLLMVPTKSVSGLVFETDHTFTSCQLRPRPNCPNRRVPYDETLYEREYCPKIKPETTDKVSMR
jgi:hypothetical protein